MDVTRAYRQSSFKQLEECLRLFFKKSYLLYLLSQLTNLSKTQTELLIIIIIVSLKKISVHIISIQEYRNGSITYTIMKYSTSIRIEHDLYIIKLKYGQRTRKSIFLLLLLLYSWELFLFLRIRALNMIMICLLLSVQV